MTKVLVALDGSDHSQKTLTTAAEKAKLDNGELIILYTCPDGVPEKSQLDYAEKQLGSEFAHKVSGDHLPEFAVAGGDGRKAISEFMDAKKTLCTSWGDAVLASAQNQARQAGVEKVRTRKTNGDVAASILSAAKEEGADLIVVGCRKANRLTGWLFDTTSKKVARNAPCKALIVN